MSYCKYLPSTVVNKEKKKNVATETFFWSCVFPTKYAMEPSNFKILLKFICFIPLLQNTTVKKNFWAFFWFYYLRDLV